MRDGKPVIGINMSYLEYRGANPENVKFRDSYDIHIAYVDAIKMFGGNVLLIPPFSDLSELDYYIDSADGFVFTGGDDYPPDFYGEKRHTASKLIHRQRADADLYLAKKVLRSRKSVLGICGGLQLVNIAFGGKIIQHIDNIDIHYKKSKTLDNQHWITIKEDSLLHRIFAEDKVLVNSAHHQSLNPKYIGKGLKVTANAMDGGIEAVELEDAQGRFLLGVQWHPERIRDSKHKRLIFNAFLSSARSFSLPSS